ncbi:RNA polymerase sigma factor [Gelidibacter maritimus]|uniref:RNA polymerase sigma factor n=1 Tax=Gelidibacter maritimus TaxID=2761487 RepID=A0A7W2R412_9FLAO|nr:RNA polymerase sigma factor [Gelidibacter maritimus]MBA6152575.1 RNA polymerase sigma factor [Gelidibacter maritimus]
MTPTNSHIEDLLEQCKSGNQHAQMEVYNRYYKAMYNTSFRIVKDSFKAEDIMQESFLTAFRKLETLKESSMFGSWLKRIVINNSIYDYHKAQKSNTVSLEDVMYKIEDDQNEPNDNEWTHLRATEVIKCMKSLKDNYQIILNLSLIEGYDYEEISEIMNISYANCRTMISRAKESLKQKLKPVEGF